MKKNLLLFLISITTALLCNVSVLAQEITNWHKDELSTPDSTVMQDSTSQMNSSETIDPFEANDTVFNNDYDFDFGQEWDFHFLSGNPAISLNYGITKMGIDKLNSDFAKVNSAEIRIGYMSEKLNHRSSYITKYKYKYFTFSNTSYELTDKKEYSGDIRTKMWQFGFGYENGYGYNTGGASIIPYHAFGINWSRLEVKDPVRNVDDRKYLEYFDDSFRFGLMAEGGVKFRLIPNLSLDASYQREIVMPRLMFWKAAGSSALLAIGQHAIDKFVDEVFNSSPAAAPIVNFVLKNALSYGFFELRKEKMSWPFETAAPLKYDTFKVGMTFVF